MIKQIITIFIFITMLTAAVTTTTTVAVYADEEDKKPKKEDSSSSSNDNKKETTKKEEPPSTKDKEVKKEDNGGNTNDKKETEKVKDPIKKLQDLFPMNGDKQDSDKTTTTKKDSDNSDKGKDKDKTDIPTETSKDNNNPDTTTSGNTPVYTTPISTITPMVHCGPNYHADKKTNGCVLNSNCKHQQSNNGIILCSSEITKKQIVYKQPISKVYISHTSPVYTTVSTPAPYYPSQTTTTNNIFNSVYNPTLAQTQSQALKNVTTFANATTTSSLQQLNQTTTAPSLILLLDAKQLCNAATVGVGTGSSGQECVNQSFFDTSSIKTIYSTSKNEWFVSGTVQNVNNVDMVDRQISNITAQAMFYNIAGDQIGHIDNIAVNPDFLAVGEEGMFNFQAFVDADLGGNQPTFMVLNYNMGGVSGVSPVTTPVAPDYNTTTTYR